MTWIGKFGNALTGPAKNKHIRIRWLKEKIWSLEVTEIGIKKLSGEFFPLFISRARTAFYYTLITVLSILIAPGIIKFFLFYFIAPLLKFSKPIVLEKYTSGFKVPLKEFSDSITHTLHANEIALVRSDYVKSSSISSKKSTRFLLNRYFPFSSIAAGMYLLTKIEGDNSVLTIGPTKEMDALVELSTVSIPSGKSLVISPQAMAGVIIREDQKVEVHSKWRLFCLNAWITLRLRFLIVHGPCKIIMKGLRGILFEEATNAGKLANDPCVLGFTPNLEFSNVRCETFMSYFTGNDYLFNDKFVGQSGFFILEKVPSSSAKGRGFRGKLEGIFEGILKIFGI